MVGMVAHMLMLYQRRWDSFKDGSISSITKRWRYVMCSECMAIHWGLASADNLCWYSEMNSVYLAITTINSHSCILQKSTFIQCKKYLYKVSTASLFNYFGKSVHLQPIFSYFWILFLCQYLQKQMHYCSTKFIN